MRSKDQGLGLSTMVAPHVVEVPPDGLDGDDGHCRDALGTPHVRLGVCGVMAGQQPIRRCGVPDAALVVGI